MSTGFGASSGWLARVTLSDPHRQFLSVADFGPNAPKIKDDGTFTKQRVDKTCLFGIEAK